MISLGSTLPRHASRVWCGATCHVVRSRLAWVRRRTRTARPRTHAAVADAAPALPPRGDPVHFSELPLDRSTHLRSQPQQLAQLLEQPGALLLPLQRGKVLVRPARAAHASPTKLWLRLEDGQALLLAAHTFAAQPRQLTAGGEGPRWLALVLPASAAAPGGALEASIDGSSTGLVFLGVMPGTGQAVFAYELPQPAAVVVCEGGDCSSSSSSSSGGGISTSPASIGGGTAAIAATTATAEAAAASGDAALLCQWADVRSAGQEMAGPDAAVLALATGLAQWHASAAFCARSGRPTVPVQGGHGRVPVPPEGTNASSQGRVRAVYPRIDPAVIVAATCGDWLLLGRKKSWDAGRYSLLAGFCEVGETLEQACVREVLEESGVELDLPSLAYHSSQPWPFPQSLMIGFVGAAAGQPAGRFTAPFHLLSDVGRAAVHDVGMTQREIQDYLLPLLPPVKVDEEELEDARWFHSSYLLAALSGGNSPFGHSDPRYYPRAEEVPFRIPGKYALANRIIWGWLRQGEAAPGGPGNGSSGSRGNSSGGEGQSGGGGWLGDLLPDVSIDEGTFKYVLMRVSEEEEAEQPQAGGSSSSSSQPGINECSGSVARAPTPCSKLIVRGDSRAAYHDHILAATKAEAAALAKKAGGGEGQPSYMSEGGGLRLKIEPLGGGRMEHYPDQRVLGIYGYSSAFGQAPHDVTAAILRRWLPFHNLTVSYDGY